MRGGADRRPGAVVDEDVGAGVLAAGADLHGGVDTDGDGLPDTLVGTDGPDLLVATDLDGDALADRVLRIGPDGAVHDGHPAADPAACPAGDPAAGTGGPVPVPGRWAALLTAILGADR